MNRFVSRLQPYLFALLNTRAAGLYILLFAIAIGAATFIENDFGTSAAQKVIYQTWWFESLLFLFGASIVYNIFKFRMIPQKKWSLLMFHSAIIVILIGAGVTRYFGYEGMMHIREGTSNDRFLSREMYLSFEVDNGAEEFAFAEQVLFASLGSNDWQESYLLGNDEIKVEVKDFIPNPKPVLYESLDGKPTVQMVIAGAQGREEYFLQAGDRKRIRGGFFNFTPERLANAINIWYRNDSLLIQSDRTMSQIVMASQQKDTLRGSAYHPLRLRSLYNDGQNNFVFADFKASGNARIESTERKDKNESVNAVVLQVSANGQSEEVFLYGRKGAPGKPQQIQLGGLQVQAAYGAQEIELPFAIGLYDFEMERYPGTNSPASYASEVQLIDSRSNHKEDFRIYMNNILNYEGYRFFQSSYDQDEKGTYLSVNHDAWGTWISYLGYALLTLGMILTLISKRTRFHQVNKQLKKMRAEYATVFVLFALGLGFQDTQASVPREEQIISQEHAADFSRVIVQDFKGRMKPVHTLSREIMRKVHRKESFQGFSADQVLLSMFARPKDWYGVEIIKLGKHPDLERKLGLSGKYAAYKDFFHQSGEYKLRQEMARVQQLAPIDRGTFEKELLKIDERVNILNMVFSGHLLRLVPRQNDPSNTWEGPHQQRQDNSGNQSSGLAERFFQSYRQALTRALEGHGYTDADALLAELDEYQRANGGEVLPSDTQRNAELMLNQFNVFNRLMGVYMLLGIGFLSCLFLSVFKPSLSLKRPFQILFGLAALGFLAHTVGLGLRWYVSERAPWSNGYESMIYIAWTTTLAGLIFTRRSMGGMAATMIQAGTILFVATLSFLDPEITPLVPVLRSYWLTIHVSLEAGSYGFLMLGAKIGLINLLLMAFLNKANHKRVKRIVKELSLLSEITLIAGLFMISVGTYLGGVWANESWGRYWGWDAKETWALVTILVYSFILHMRIIPKVFSLYAYNVASIFGLASVIMTYYGVNYYLSGLHSYAAGDPVPIPNWVYIGVGVVTALSALAWWKSKRFPMGR